VFRRGKSIVGLDLGSQAVKAVEITLEGPSRGHGLRARRGAPGQRQGPGPGGGLPARALQLAQRGHLGGRAVGVVRYVAMPRMSDHELKQAVRIEADRYVPFQLDEVVLDCQPLRRRPRRPEEAGATRP